MVISDIDTMFKGYIPFKLLLDIKYQAKDGSLIFTIY